MTDILAFEPTPVVDRALLEAFRMAMLERKRARTAAAAPDSDVPVINGLFADDAQELTEVTPIPPMASHEPAPGFGYDLGEIKPSTVGGHKPSPELSYALNRVLSLRKFLEDSPTIEPTDWTLEELARIEKYNRDLVETKRPEKK